MIFPKLSKRILKVNSSPTLFSKTKAEEMRRKGINIVNFGAGEPGFVTPKCIINSAIQAMEKGFTHYTDPSGIDELKEAVQEKLKKDNGLSYEKDGIIISSGGKHALYNIIQVLCQEDDEVIIPAPYWTSYPEMVKLSGAKPVIVPTLEKDNFILSPRLLERAITNKTKVFIFNNPCNPTGVVYERKRLEEIANVIKKKNIFIISDEVYEYIVYDGQKHVSFASLDDKLKEFCFTVNSLSKTYAMTGWRIGYAVGPKNIISKVKLLQSQSTSNPNSIAQKASVTALHCSSNLVMEMVEEYKQRRDYIVKRINQMGISYSKPAGTFYVFPNISKYFGRKYGNNTITDSQSFADLLLEKEKVMILSGAPFGSKNHVRLSYGATSLEEIKLGMNNIENFFNKLY